MNDYSFLLIPVFIIIGSLGCTQIDGANNDITASRAFVILTSESWGCLNGQEIKQDVTDLLKRDDDKFAKIPEIKNPTLRPEFPSFLLKPAT